MTKDEHSKLILEGLKARVEELCQKLLPNGKRKGNEWVVGNAAGKPGDSLGVVLSGEKLGLYNDRAGDGGSLWKLWSENRGISFADAAVEICDWLGIPKMDKSSAPSERISLSSYQYEEPKESHLTKPEPASDPMPEHDPIPPHSSPLDWDSCIMDFTDAHAEAVCKDRGYSRQFVAWLHEQEMIGIYKGCVAFPVHNDKGEVMRVHFKRDHWEYHPRGGETAALIVGTPIAHASEVLAFESQWDAFAMLDALNAHHAENAGRYCAYITRGASSNTNLSKVAVPKLIACPQNDPAEKASKSTGRTPAEEWLFRIQGTKHKSTQLVVFETPSQHKDANDWIRADKPSHEQVLALFTGAKNPLLKHVKTAGELMRLGIEMKGEDPDSLIGYEKRFLGRGGSMLIIGPSGIGKSTLTTSFLCHAATGIPWNGIKFRKPLRVLSIQAENDDGDLSEMITGIFRDKQIQIEFGMDGINRLANNLLFRNLSDKTGAEFINHLEQMVRELEIDLVCIDPLLSYVGDDISQQKVASTFLRNNLLPVMKSTGVMVVIVHHSGKPPKDKGPRQSNSDLSYMGLGSSELVNWARAVCCIVPTEEDAVFEFRITKRGSRAGMINQFTGEKTDHIHICHNQSGDGIFWMQTKYEAPEPEKKESKGGKSGWQGKRINTSEYIDLIPNRIANAALVELLRTQAGMNTTQVKWALSDLMAAGLMKNMGDGSWEKQA